MSEYLDEEDMEKYNLAWPVTVVGEYDIEAMDTFLAKFGGLLKQKKIVIFGAGIRGTIFSKLLEQKGFTELLFSDNNENKIGHFINEYQIVPLEEVLLEKEKYFIIISVENGQSIKKQLSEMGLDENQDFASVENHVYEKYVKKFSTSGDWETMILGDCGLSDVGIKEEKKKNLAELLEEILGSDKTKVLALHGMGMRAYYEIIRAHSKYIKQPQKIMIMANFETFTGKQHLFPRSQHVTVFEMLYDMLKDEDIYQHMCLTQKRFSDITMDYFTSAKEHSNRGQNNDKLVVKMNYMYRLNLQNECIQYMWLISEFCNENGIDLSFFIPPVNYQYAEQLWGEKFQERYKDNCQLLIDEWNKKKIPYLDMSYLLHSEYFADKRTIDECANYEGRIRQASRISEFIMNM